MSDRIAKIIADELQTARGRVTFLEYALRECQRLPDADVKNLRLALSAHGLAVIASDALRVALDRFDVADTAADDEGLGAHADWADIHAARDAIDEAWRASK